MKVAIIQLGINDEETKEQRLLRVEGIIEELEGTDLIILPELWNIGFFSYEKYHSESETLDGDLVSRLSEKARKTNSYIFTGSFVEQRNGRFYNTCVLLDRKGQIAGDYSKIHLFGNGSAETKLLSPGEKVDVINTDFGKVGLSICYDLRFPELYRRMADQGAEVIISCAAWPYPRVENWDVLNKARAIENQCYYLACGCAGSSQGKPFIGRSMVVDPWGTVVTNASEREMVLKTEIYPENVAKIREEFTPLKDRVLK